MIQQNLEQLRKGLRKLEREIEIQIKDNGSCCGITLSQCHVLMELGGLTKTSLTALATLLQVDKSTLSRTIDAMVNSGLVERIIDADDRRYMELSLTPSGRSSFHSVNRVCNIFYEKVFSLLPAERHEEIIRDLLLFTDAMIKARKELGDGCCQLPGVNEEAS